MDKRNLYTTAIVNTDELAGLPRGSHVGIVAFHESSETFSIRSCETLNTYSAKSEYVIQAYVPENYLTRFVL